MSIGTAELSVSQRQVLQSTYDWFRETGTWPHARELDRLLDRAAELDVVAIAPSIPPSLIVWDRRGGEVLPDQAVKLTIAGIATCEQSKADLKLFLRILRYCVDRERRAPPPEPGKAAEVLVTRHDIAVLLGIDRRPDAESEIVLRKAYELLLVNGDLWNQASGNDDSDWSFSLDRRIRKYRKVSSLENWLALKNKEDASITTPTAAYKDSPDGPQDFAERVGVGLGLAVGSVLVFFLGPLLLGASPGWRVASFLTGSVLGSIGLGGALIYYSDVRDYKAYNDWGVSIILAGIGVALLGFQRSQSIGGAVGAFLIAVSLIMILLAVMLVGVGAAKRPKPRLPYETVPPQGTQVGDRQPLTEGTAGRERLSKYERLTLGIAAASVLVNLIAVFVSKWPKPKLP